MTWGSFMDFWIMREMGHEDAVFRNYDLTWNLGKGASDIHLFLAFNRLGLIHTKGKADISLHMAEVRQRLLNTGQRDVDENRLALRLCAWHNWDRIRAGEVQKFMLRSRSR